jgi:hypothetical protein
MARKKILPTSIIVRRNDPKRNRFVTPQVNARFPVVIQPETAPKPIDSTSYYGIGRDPTHAWPHVYVYQALAIQDKLSVMAWAGSGSGLVERVVYPNVVHMPQGNHIYTTERTNIESPRNVAYGSLAALNPAPSWSPAYGKVTP